MNIKIITDSTADLLPEIYKEKDIEVIPLNVTIGGMTYKDGVEITSKELFEKVQEYNEMPKSACENALYFENLFKTRVSEGYDVLYMGIGKELSATYANALIALDELTDEEKKHVRLVDSANLSSGTGLLLLKAIKFREEGQTLDEIALNLEKLTNLVRSQFAINTLEYLHKGGRCSGTTKIFGTLLKIKPIIKVRDGSMTIGKKPLGKFEKALDVMIEMFKDDFSQNNVDLDCVMVTHCLAFDDAKYIKERLEKMIPANVILETYASSTISVHCGPRTIGILYMLKEN